MAKFVTREDINREYSDMVVGLLATGWTIFTPTMNNSPLDTEAEIHLINRENTIVYSITLTKTNAYRDVHRHVYSIRIISNTAEDMHCESLKNVYSRNDSHSLWNYQGDVVYRKAWYGFLHGNGHGFSYTADEDEVVRANKRAHRKANFRPYDDSSRIVKVNSEKLVKFVRKHGGRSYRNVRIQDICPVTKFKSKIRPRYCYRIAFYGTRASIVL